MLNSTGLPIDDSMQAAAGLSDVGRFKRMDEDCLPNSGTDITVDSLVEGRKL
ncbi:hypothetical protein FG05_35326 [Fusarium graminearum]|nr:hypothetical protein FG05_35326 [Fusarium graminearum]